MGNREDGSTAVASMTGFARAAGQLSGRLRVAIVLRSVNHRHLDVLVRHNLRDEVPEAEAAVRSAIVNQLERGRVSAQIRFEMTEAPAGRVLVNRQLVEQLVDELDQLGLEGSRAADLLAVPGVLTVSEDEVALTEGELEALARVTGEAIDELVRMRRDEGERLVAQIRAEADTVAAFLGWLEPRLADVRARLLDKVRERLAALLGPDLVPDDERLLQEAALQADKADVAEETVRLRSHLEQLASRFRQRGAIGRSLDFLCQEMQRELNTIGAKAREAGVSERLVDAKTAVERIREQVQNLE